MSLNKLCLKVRLGNGRAMSELLKDSRVSLIINQAAHSIANKSPGFDAHYLVATLKTILWENISKNYKPVKELGEDTDLYVLRYIKSFAFKKLLNFVEKERNLRRTYKNGYVPRLAVVRSDAIEEFGFIETPGKIEDKITIQTALNRVINLLTQTGRLNEIDAFIITIKYNTELTFDEIASLLSKHYGFNCTHGWVSHRLNREIYPQIRAELDRIGIGKEDVL